MFGKRILILIPHPDDEVVGCAAAIARARSQGARVFGCYLSHGYLPMDALWKWQRGGYEKRVQRRLKEMEQAAEFLGITIVGKNTKRAAREIWRELPQVRDEVLKAMSECAPDRIWVPAFEGGNPDHDGVNALASTLPDVPVFEFSEYNLAGGYPHSNSFLKQHGMEVVHRLRHEERALKRQALNIYKSERGNVSGLQIMEEQFRPLAKYAYAARPHDGQLWYERFQWAPFKQPRVDYTKARDVSDAISAFLGQFTAL